MIIDIHTHAAFSKLFPNQFVKQMFKYDEESISHKKLEQLIRLLLNDKDGSHHIKNMDAAGIDHSVVLIVDGGVGMGEGELSLEKIYQHHNKIFRRFEDRLTVFAGIDPRRDNSLDIFKRGIEHYGFRGLKLYPPMGFSLDTNSLKPILNYCNDYGLPVMVHTGPSLDSLYNEYSDPLCIKNILRGYPKINFILAHAVLNLSTDLIDLLKSYNNLYIDISGFQPRIKDGKFDIAQFSTETISKKILYGSDWPLFNLFSPIKRDIDLLIDNINMQNLPNSLNEDIFFNNAKRFLSTK